LGMLALFAKGFERTRFISYKEARPLLQLVNANRSLEVPGESEMPEDVWLKWIKSKDAEIRSRLRQGDEDTMINFMLWGVSFTRYPRVSEGELHQFLSSRDEAKAGSNISLRTDDLIRSLDNPGDNQRLSFLREMVLSLGYRLDVPEEKDRLRKYLFAGLRRVLQEQAGYAQKVESIKALGPSNEALAEFSHLYQNRGLSLDTSLPICYAIDHSLKAMLAKEIIKPSSIMRIAIIGPGLDFADKNTGYDFYPEQTLQPFAVADSLVNLKLSKPAELEITTLDISPRINWHLQQMVKAKPLEYTLQLPIDPGTKPDSGLLAYWEQMGNHIGKACKPVPLPDELSHLKVRAVSINPQIISRIQAADLDIIYQSLDLPENEKFDLIIATNVLVYYNTLEQSLALSNIEKMLNPNGLLLCNNALWAPPVLHMNPVEYESTKISDSNGDGIMMFSYINKAQ
jgi:hypothetical protein